MTELKPFEQIKKHFETLKIPDSFLFDILKVEDDWTFLIKSHFLVEGCLKKALCAKIGNAKLDRQIEKLNYNKVISWLVDVAELDRKTVKFVFYIQELRNRLIHDLGQHEFSFEDLFEDRNETNRFISAVENHCVDKIKIDSQVLSKKEFLIQNPRIGILFGIVTVLLDARILHLESENARDIRTALDEMMVKLLSKKV